MKITPIYREIPQPRQIAADAMWDVIAERIMLVLDEMERQDEKRDEDPERWDGME